MSSHHSISHLSLLHGNKFDFDGDYLSVLGPCNKNRTGKEVHIKSPGYIYCPSFNDKSRRILSPAHNQRAVIIQNTTRTLGSVP